MIKKNYIIEIAYCIESQYYPDTRVYLAVCGMWRNGLEHKGRPNLKSPYEKWIEELYHKSVKFCKKEKLI
jgi:hypothetical protein